ncbi:MAG TPA: EAL domain-containing protein [Candidatus Nanopelagicales bacterium]|jgi:diguanylate cyclase (GGDEF)-like protein|nr:EAL domain-containing protein [Candidatus Nanopelagicales bacterium]
MRRRKSLTKTFAIVSLLTLSALGVSLVLLVSQLIKQQAVDEAVLTASAYATAGIEEKISVPEWEKEQLSPRTLADLNSLSTNTSGVRLDDTLLGVRLWSGPGQLLFDSAKGGAATGFPDGRRLDSAVRQGVSSAALITEVDGQESGVRSDARTVLDVYVPARADGAVKGVIEVVLNYDQTAAATAEAIRQVAILVLGGLVLVWLLLFRNVRNASKRLRQSAVENARLALLDPLTGLPNRRLLSERLERAVDNAAEEDNHVGLLLLDIDRFKEINDSLGHDRGDMLLITVSERLQEVVRETDTVARLGGDEFAVLLPTVRGVDDASTLAERVLGVFAEPYQIDGLTLHVEASLGLALLPDHADDVTALMKRADVAMYAAKAARRGMSVYSAAGDLSSPAKLLLLGDLRQAIDTEDQLSISYQPKLDLQTGEVCGLEALLRWNHPVRGAISPTEFIPLAEQTGLIHSLTHKVLELVLVQLQQWRAGGWNVQVAVNLSALNLAEPDLEERISSMLQQYDVPPELLEFEITESAILADPERAAGTLARIAAMGSTIALDDFGTGNTSLSQLRDLPIDTLKIDRTFITDLSANGELLVKVVNDLAHQFHMVVVAEGVEEQEIAVRLRELGCDRAQGFLYARPVPAAELPAVLARLGHVRPAADLSMR